MPVRDSNVVSLGLPKDESVVDRQAAITRLVENHELELRRYLRNSLSNSADVDDILQDVFCRVLRDEKVLGSTLIWPRVP